MKPIHPGAPLPPPPTAPELVYGEDPITGELTAEPVAARGAVSIPLARLAEYLDAYGLVPDYGRPGGALEEVTGLGWTVFVRGRG